MGAYIGLINYADESIRTVVEAAERTDVGRNTLKSLGGEMKQVFMVMPSGPK